MSIQLQFTLVNTKDLSFGNIYSHLIIYRYMCKRILKQQQFKGVGLGNLKIFP